MKTFFLFLLMGMFLTRVPAQESPEKPAHMDEAMGLTFPAELAGFHFKGKQVYSGQGKGLGYSLRYEGEGTQKLDIYIYDKELREIPRGVDNAPVRKEALALLSELRQVEKLGHYKDLRILATDEKIKFSGIYFLRSRFQYEQLKKPASNGTLASESLITGWGDSFVKVHYSYALSEKEQGEKTAGVLPAAIAALLNTGGPEGGEGR